MIKTSEGIKEISTALYGVQKAVHAVKKDSKNPHFKSNYASLEVVMDTVKPALQSVDVLLTQGLGTVVEGALEVTTRLTHVESGEWLESTMHVPLQKRDPQGVGSAATYGLRYSIMALLGLPPIDDDGEAAIDRNPPKQEDKDAAKNDAARNLYSTLESAMRLATTKAELRSWWSNPTNVSARNRLPSSWQGNLREESIKLAGELPDGHEEQKVA
jgi:hypothetical protein